MGKRKTISNFIPVEFYVPPAPRPVGRPRFIAPINYISHVQPVGGRQSSGPFPAGPSSRNAADGDQHFFDYGGDDGYPADAPEPVLRGRHHRTTAEDNQRLHAAWEEERVVQVSQKLAAMNREAARQGDEQSRLRSCYEDACTAALPRCQAQPACGGAYVQAADASEVLFVDIKGHVRVKRPLYRCSDCQHQHELHPAAIGCFPSTPKEPEVFYSEELLELTARLQVTAPYAINALSTALGSLHLSRGCGGDGGRLAWRHLGRATRQYLLSQAALEEYCRTHVALIRDEKGAFLRCPACWEMAYAAMCDACVGIKHNAKCGTASTELEPQHCDPRMIPESVVKARLEQRRRGASEPDLRPCSNMTAATSAQGASKTEHDLEGLAFVCCRHEFFIAGLGMLTNENYTYHELLLEDLVQKFNGDPERCRLKFFFLDVACQFEAYWRRTHAEAPLLDRTPMMRVGPFHEKMHIYECQLEYGARHAEGAALCFGDNIEHIWAHLRKHAGRMKYMAKSELMNFLMDLVRHMEELKEEKLPRTLELWNVRAERKQADMDVLIADRHAELTRLDANWDAAAPCAAVADAAPALPAKLGWTHEYQEVLENLGDLAGLLSSPPSASGESVAAQRRRKRGVELEERAAALEAKHRVEQRWRPEDARYLAAQSERKEISIAKLQRTLSGLRIRYFTLQKEKGKAVGRRHEVRRIVQQQDTAKKAMKHALEELQAWHAAPGNAAPAGYDAAAVTVDLLLEEDAVLPWEGPAATHAPVHVLRRQLEEHVQLRQRCVEERAVLRREADDVVRFYEHQVNAIADAMARTAGAAPVSELQVGDHIYEVPTHLQTAVVGGVRHVLDKAARRCDRLLQRARVALRNIHASALVDDSDSSSEEDSDVDGEGFDL